MNRSLDRHNKKTITKAYHMKKTHFQAPGRMKKEANRRKKALIERTRARLKEEAWEESHAEPLELIPGGETFHTAGRDGSIGTVIGYEPKRKLFLGVGHVIGNGEDQTGKQIIGYPTKLVAGKLVFDTSRPKEVGKLAGTVLHNNEYGCVVSLYIAPAGKPVPLGMPVEGEAQVYHESLNGGKKDICLRVNGRTGELRFRLPELTRGMSGSPVLQNGKIVGVLTHGDERGNAMGLQITEIVGGLLSAYEIERGELK